MGVLRLLALGIAAVAAGLGGSTSLPAQCRLCEQPSTQSSALAGGDGPTLEIAASLNFDRLILAAPGAGAAVVRPDGTNSTEGSIAAISARAMVGTAIVHGTPGRAVRVQLPSRIELYSTSGGRISLDDLVTDLPDLPKLDADGNLSFRFGGRVAINGDSEGNYRGEMPITVEYQ